jgi:hypothetical protein
MSYQSRYTNGDSSAASQPSSQTSVGASTNGTDTRQSAAQSTVTVADAGPGNEASLNDGGPVLLGPNEDRTVDAPIEAGVSGPGTTGRQVSTNRPPIGHNRPLGRP